MKARIVWFSKDYDRQGWGNYIPGAARSEVLHECDLDASFVQRFSLGEILSQKANVGVDENREDLGGQWHEAMVSKKRKGQLTLTCQSSSILIELTAPMDEGCVTIDRRVVDLPMSGDRRVICLLKMQGGRWDTCAYHHVQLILLK